MLNQPQVFGFTAESDPDLWDILQRPEDRQPPVELPNPFPELPAECFDQAEIQDKMRRLQEQISALKLQVHCSVHGLGDRNISRLREEVEGLEDCVDRSTGRLDQRIDELRADLDRAEIEIISLKYSGPPPELGDPAESNESGDRSYRKTRPVAAVGGIGFLLLCFSVVSFAVAGFSSSSSQKDYHAGLAGMLACAGLGTIAAAVATNWGDD